MPYSRCLPASFLIAACSIALQASCGDGGEAGGPDFGPPVPHRRLEVVDSIGIELGDEAYVFGSVSAAVVTTGGRIVLNDITTFRTSIFDSEGRFLGWCGGEGEGPGEYTRPSGLAPTPGGGFAITDQGCGKVMFFDSSGVLLEEIAGFAPETPVSVVVLPGRAIVGSTREFDRENGTAGTSVCRWEPGETSPSTVYYTRMVDLDPQNPSRTFSASSVSFSAAGDGRVFVSPAGTEAYSITCFSPGGEVLWVSEPPFTRRRRSEEDLANELEVMERVFERRGRPGMIDYWEAEEWCTAVSDLDVSEGLLWARRGTERVPWYDVLDLDGNRLFTCSADRFPFWAYAAVAHGGDFSVAYLADPDDYPRLYILELGDPDPGAGP